MKGNANKDILRTNRKVKKKMHFALASREFCDETVNRFGMPLEVHLMEKFLSIAAEIALPILEVFVSKMPHRCIVPRPLLNTLVLRERPISKTLETSFRPLGITDILFDLLKKGAWGMSLRFRLTLVTDQTLARHRFAKPIVARCGPLRSTPKGTTFRNGAIFGDCLDGCISSRPLVFQRARRRPGKHFLQEADLFPWHLNLRPENLLGLFIVDRGPRQLTLNVNDRLFPIKRVAYFLLPNP
jgi:hypothetical protein